MQISTTKHAGRRTAAVIALHSSAAPGRQWQVLGERMHDLDFVAPDLLGHGDAPSWTGAPQGIVDADVARVARIAEEHADAVHLIGHSYGGAVAIAFALAHPGRVRSVAVYEPVLFGALFAAEPLISSPIRVIASYIESSLAAGAPEHAAQMFVDFWGGEGAWKELPTSRRAAIASRMPTVSAHFVALAGSPIRLAHLPSLRMPVLHLSGETSPLAMRRLEKRIRHSMPDAEFVTMTAMGHMGPLTRPHTVAQRIERFVRARIAEDEFRTRRAA